MTADAVQTKYRNLAPEIQAKFPSKTLRLLRFFVGGPIPYGTVCYVANQVENAK